MVYPVRGILMVHFVKYVLVSLSVVSILFYAVDFMEGEQSEISKAVYNYGRESATYGIPHTACPYSDHRKTLWLEGWIEGKKNER